MFAYFQTYLRSLSQKDHLTARGYSQQPSQNKKRYFNFSQNDHASQLDFYESDDKTDVDNGLKQSRIDTERTVRNSLHRTEFT